MDCLDGASIQILLNGPSFFGVVSHVMDVDIILTQQVSISTCSIIPVLSFFVKIYDNEFFSCMFDLEFFKFIVDLERIYGQQPLEPININTTSNNVSTIYKIAQ
jgi:hypothetical protein